MIRTFYIVRHGETEWNKVGRLQGHTDIPLSPNGFAQAELLKPLVSSLSPEVIYSSPLKRAFQTAQSAAGGLPNQTIKTDHRLMEVKLGEVEGLTGPEIYEKYGEESFERWRNLDWNDEFKYPGGEGKKESVSRIESFFRQDHQNHFKIMIVSHGLVLRRFLGWVTKDKEFVRIPNTTVFHLDLDLQTKEFSFKGVLYQPKK